MPRLKQQKPRHIIGALLDVEQQDQDSDHSSNDKINTEDEDPRVNEMQLQRESISQPSSESPLPPIPPLRKDIEDSSTTTSSPSDKFGIRSNASYASSSDMDTPTNIIREDRTEEEDLQAKIMDSSFNYFKQSLQTSAITKLSGDDYSLLIKNMWNNLLKQFMDKMANTEEISDESNLRKSISDFSNYPMRVSPTDDKQRNAAAIKVERNEMTEDEKIQKSPNEMKDMPNCREHAAPQSASMMNAWKEYMAYRELCINHWKKQAQLYEQSIPTLPQAMGANLGTDHFVPNAYAGSGFGSWPNSLSNYLVSTSNSQQLPYYNNNYALGLNFDPFNKHNFVPTPAHSTHPSQQSPPNNSASKNNIGISSYANTTPAYTTGYEANPDFGQNSNTYNERSAIETNIKSRKSRTRSSAVHSIGDAIVREAKQQLKGVDPENMYIPCPICHKRIKRLYHFQRHMRIHSGEKSHHCPFCPYKSVRKDNLKSHMKTHEKHSVSDNKRFRNINTGDSNDKLTDLDYPNKSRFSREDQFRNNGLLAVPGVPPNTVSPGFPIFNIANPDLRITTNIRSSPDIQNASQSNNEKVEEIEFNDSTTKKSSKDIFSLMAENESLLIRKRTRTPSSNSPAEKMIKLSEDEKINENNCNNVPNESITPNVEYIQTSPEESSLETQIQETAWLSRLNKDHTTKFLNTSPDRNLNSFNKEPHSQNQSVTKPMFTSSSVFPVAQIDPCSPAVQEKKESTSISNDATNKSVDVKCRVCNFVASSTPSLQTHMATHKEGGYYKCSECNYHGKNLSKLIEHNRIHTGERPFQCDQCSYAAKRKDNLAQHKNVKHKIPTLTCSKQTDRSSSKITSPSMALSHGLAMMKESKSFTYPSFPSSLLSIGNKTAPKLETNDEIKFNFSLSVSAPKYSWKPDSNKTASTENEKPEMKPDKSEKTFANYENSVYNHSKLSVSPTAVLPRRAQQADINYMGYSQRFYYPYLAQQHVYPMFPYQTNGLDMQRMVGYTPAHAISQTNRIKGPTLESVDRPDGEQTGTNDDKSIYTIPPSFRVPGGSRIGMT